MGTSAALAAVWFVTDRSYRSAYETYRNTRLNDLSLDQRGADAGTDAFTQNFERANPAPNAPISHSACSRWCGYRGYWTT